MEKEEELFIPKTKHKALKIILATLLIIGLITGGYFLYQYKFNNPKVIINNILDSVKTNIDSEINKFDEKEKYRVNGYIKMDANINKKDLPIADILTDLELQFNGEVDKTNDIANVTLSTKYRDDKLIDVKAYYEKHDVYALFEGLYDKYLTTNINDEETINYDIKKDDIKVIYQGIIEALKEELDKQDIKKTDAKIKINGQEVDVINNYLELKDKEINTFTKNIINTLKKNKEFINALTKINGKDGKTILEELEKEEIKEEAKGIYKINFYTDKGLFNKKLISIRQNISQENGNSSINIDVISDEEILATISNNGVTFTIKTKRSNSTLNLTISEEVNGENISVDININYEKIKEVTKIDVSKSKKIDQLTEKEIEEIYTKLEKNEVLQKLVEEISKSFNKKVY